MKAMAGLISIIIMLAAIALPGTALAKSAGDDAFLIEYADSVQGLVTQVEDSRLLVLRYAKHFKADPSAVIAYFRNEISIETLKEKTTVDVYKRKGTSFESETKELKAGTKVFVNSNGIPILEIGSGNPLADSLPGKDVKKLPAKPTTIEDLKATSSAAEQPQVAANPTETPVLTAQAPDQLPTAVPGSESSPLATPSEPDVAVLSSGPIETVAKVATKAGGSGIMGWLLPAAGIAGAALLGSGGGSGSDAPILPPGGGSGDNNDLPAAVPEPASIIALGAGLVSLAGIAHRRKRAW